MSVGDIFHMEDVPFPDGINSKSRYIMEVEGNDYMVFVADNITSQFESKSEFIKLQYFEIKDYQEAGLKVPSYVDILSTKSFDLKDLIVSSEFVGSLSESDLENFDSFQESYEQRVKAFNDDQNHP